ncbi:MAG: thioredoxin family protein, partial [Myxococcales bacterium]
MPAVTTTTPTTIDAVAPALQTFHCKSCGRAIFHSAQIAREVNLWDLGDYQAWAYQLTDDVDVSGLRRYDVSLHEGWYCCRFIAMRMTVDKFGTGRSLLVYRDSVEARSEAPATTPAPQKAQLRLTEVDFDRVVGDAGDDRLKVVKVGAIWCPPCRLMDAVIERIAAAPDRPEVDFFEIDADASPELAARFAATSIPYLRFFYRGEPVQVRSRRIACDMPPDTMAVSPSAYRCSASASDFGTSASGLNGRVPDGLPVTSRDPEESLWNELQQLGLTTLVRIGDCKAPGLIAHAVYDGHRFAREFDGDSGRESTVGVEA